MPSTDLLAIFFASIILIYFQSSSTQFTFDRLPAFESEPAFFRPIVADINGNGLNDLVVVHGDAIEILDTTALSIGVSSVAFAAAKGGGIPHRPTHTHALPVRHQATLRGRGISLDSAIVPVAVACSHRHVGVLTSGWRIKLFSSELELLWESVAPATVPRGYAIVDAGVVVEVDSGLVIASGRVRRVAVRSYAHTSGYASDTDTDVDVDVVDDADAAVGSGSSMMYFAFGLGDGKLVWEHAHSHSPHSRQASGSSSNHGHSGEVGWRRYRRSVLDCLPFAAGSASSTLEARYFSKRKQVQSNLNPNPSPSPNVLVSHTPAAMQILHLSSGHMLTQVHFTDSDSGGDSGSGGNYLDIDGDGVLDRVVIHTTGHNAHAHIHGSAEPLGHAAMGRGIGMGMGMRMGQRSTPPSCWMEVVSGYPHAEQLFNGSLCPVDMGMGIGVGAGAGTGTGAGAGVGLDAEVAVAPPVFIPSLRDRDRDHGHGHDRVGGFDSVFLTNAGIATSFTPEGQLKWQVETPCSGRGTLSPFRIHTAPQHRYAVDVICTGERSVAVLSGETGAVIASISQDDLPYLYLKGTIPVVGDLNNDGHSDIVVQLEDDTWCAFLLEKSKGAGGASTLLVGLAAVVAIVAGGGVIWVWLGERHRWFS